MNIIEKNNIEDILGLTPMQEGMLFHYRKEPQSRAYYEQLSLEISGPIDKNLFQRAWNVVVESNEMLRTMFHWQNTKSPIQIHLKRQQPLINFRDCRPKKNRDASAIHKHEKNGWSVNDKTFDLTKVPFGVTLCKLEEGGYRMIIANHHILYDGWSSGIILKEFFEAYSALIMGRDPVKTPKTRFKEFVKWHRNKAAAAETFWRDYLKDLDPLELSIKKRPAVEIHKEPPTPGTIGIQFYPELKRRAEAFAGRLRITLATLLYSTWGILLQKYNNCDDTVFGTTVSGRSSKLKGIENMVGLFINTVPLRCRTSPEETVSDMLNRIQRQMQARESVEYTSLVKIKEYSGLLNRDILFDTLVVLENYPLDEALKAGNKAKKQDGQLTVLSCSMEEMPHYALTLGITPGDVIHCRFLYRKDVLREDSVRLLAAHYVRILESALESPEGKIVALDMLLPEEKKRILLEFNTASVDYPGAKTICFLVAQQMEKTPDRVSLTAGSRCGAGQIGNNERRMHITYRELDVRAHRLARFLKGKGVGPDTIVAIKTGRSVEMIIGLLGILKAGGAYLPIDPAYPQERIDYMLKDSNAGHLLTTGEYSQTKSGTSILLIEEILYAEPSPSSRACGGSPAAAKASALAYIIYTSGSTGLPKGVATGHGNLMAYVFAFLKQFDINSRDVVIQQASYSFDAFVEELYPVLLKGGILAVAQREQTRDIPRLAGFIARHQVSMITCSPLMLEAFNRLREPALLSSLRLVISGGDILEPRYIDGLLTLGAIYNTYGPTEGTVCATYHRCSGDESPIPIGKPIANYRVYILDKHRQPLPIGAAGELCIAGPGVSRGYLNKPELTAETFIDVPIDSTQNSPHTVYFSGDLARWQPDGSIEFLGRLDQQVQVRGFRIELGEIEYRLQQHEQVEKAVVIDRKSPGGDNCICAYWIPLTPATGPEDNAAFQTGEVLRDYLAKSLPDYMLPQHIVQLDEIPLNVGGKVHRRALPEPGKTSRGQASVPPR
ncbi:MAG: amino acid adenylation domain-containing protein, partial [bacterium]|nr:amino acid adenylation domain-containing protein [bacterium]